MWYLRHHFYILQIFSLRSHWSYVWVRGRDRVMCDVTSWEYLPQVGNVINFIMKRKERNRRRHWHRLFCKSGIHTLLNPIICLPLHLPSVQQEYSPVCCYEHVTNRKERRRSFMTGMETQGSFISKVIEIIKHMTCSVHCYSIVCFNLHKIMRWPDLILVRGENEGRQLAGKAFHLWNKSKGWLATSMMQHSDIFIICPHVSCCCWIQ